MEAAAGISSPPPDADSATRKSDENVVLVLQELQSLRRSHEALQSQYSAAEKSLAIVQKQRDEALEQNCNLEMAVCETTLELDLLRELIGQLEVFCREKQSEIERSEISRRTELGTELETCRARIEELEFNIKQSEDKNEVLSKSLVSLLPAAKHHLLKIIRYHDDGKTVDSQLEKESEGIGEAEDELKRALRELSKITRLASEAESVTKEFEEREKKEKKMLEDSIVSLTEENRDLNTFLRVALMEKEAVERNLNKLKGSSAEHKKAALFQIAERGLQRVGFGFIIGSSSSEEKTAEEESGSEVNRRSDDGDGDEEESVSLASTVERVMKNLRLEITELRRSLEDSRSDCEQLQSLAERQAQSIAETAVYIQELEDRCRVSAQNVEKLMAEIREAEAEAGRWMEACELEVEAGKKEVAERDKVIAIMKLELEKTRAALQISDGKLKMKEELAGAAMAAQAAAEQSLQLADSRANQFRSRMEELSRQLEAAESRDRVRHKARHRCCWPWSGLRDNSNNNGRRRRLPEMQPLLS
ncbi:unnamed protein product [Linum tenue]|uniref:Uncharacterized protein n=1 Tax=Linum tenue TaxID=586396 RepID=A0AAV0QP10_9ROSI|nr:unnamed protein product [Linum tenue]